MLENNYKIEIVIQTALHMYASDPEGNVLHLAQNL